MKKRKLPETRKSRKARTAPFQAEYDIILEKLVLARQNAGFTQREVSALMGRAPNFLTRCESGVRSLDIIELLELARVYNKQVIDFLSDL